MYLMPFTKTLLSQQAYKIKSVNKCFIEHNSKITSQYYKNQKVCFFQTSLQVFYDFYIKI